MITEKGFLEDCWALVRALGREDTKAAARAQVGWGMRATGAVVFRDRLVEIIVEKAPSKRMLVTKIDNHNPIVCTDKDGHAFRWHGEFSSLASHVRVLAIQLHDDEPPPAAA